MNTFIVCPSKLVAPYCTQMTGCLTVNKWTLSRPSGSRSTILEKHNMQVEFFLEMLERPNLCYFFKSRGFDDANYDIPIPCPMCQIPKFMDLVMSEFVIYAVEYPHLFLDTGCTICSICTLLDLVKYHLSMSSVRKSWEVSNVLR